MGILAKASSDVRLGSHYIEALFRQSVVRPLVDWSAFKRFVSTVLRHDFAYGVRKPVPVAYLSALLPDLTSCELKLVGEHWSYEILCLCSAVRSLDARRVVEIGTFEGAATLQMAANLAPDGRIVTVDMPPDALSSEADISDFDRSLVEKPADRVGRHYRNTPYASRVTQILQDSAAVEYRDYFDAIDVAFIDGGHSYTQVKADTERVLPLVRPGGVVFWHDYQPCCPGVTRYIHELAHEHAIVQIKGTELAALRLPAG